MKIARPFTHIDTWVFDLDNTLYPHHVNLWQQVDARIGEFIGAFLKISAEEARVIQKDYYRRYGTSMRGMMTEHGVHADDYLAYVHKIDHSPLEPNPAMGAAIAKLPGRKLILTNGSTDHAGAVLERLGITEHFEAVFDIIAAELGRPERAVHAREQVRSFRTGRLRHPRTCRDRLCAGGYEQRRKDAAICDAMMQLRPRSIVVPANAGTHNHRIALLIATPTTAKATATVLNYLGHGVWVPAFAGTTR